MDEAAELYLFFNKQASSVHLTEVTHKLDEPGATRTRAVGCRALNTTHESTQAHDGGMNGLPESKMTSKFCAGVPMLIWP